MRECEREEMLAVKSLPQANGVDIIANNKPK